MFDLEEQMENGMHAAVDFLNADTKVRNTLMHTLSQFGDEGLQAICYELPKMMGKRGIAISPEHLKDVLIKIYEFGMQRYIGEYDNTSLSEKDIFNDNVEVELKGVDNVMRRKKRVSGMVSDLECSDHHVPSPWFDFVNRGYSEIKKKIYEQLGDSAVDKFEYYFNYETREILKSGLTQCLTSAYHRTVDELQYLNTATMKLEEQVKNNTNTISVNAAMFK